MNDYKHVLRTQYKKKRSRLYMAVVSFLLAAALLLIYGFAEYYSDPLDIQGMSEEQIFKKYEREIKAEAKYRAHVQLCRAERGLD